PRPAGLPWPGHQDRRPAPAPAGAAPDRTARPPRPRPRSLAAAATLLPLLPCPPPGRAGTEGTRPAATRPVARPGSGQPPLPACRARHPRPDRPRRRLRRKRRLAARGGGDDRLDQVTGAAAEDVAQRGQRGQAEPLRDAGDQPVDLLAGQRDATLG